jgi:4'-phosphopantetheinyl transferase
MSEPLRDDEIHVWFVRTDSIALDNLVPLLDDGERRRADCFRFEKDRRHSIVARGALRLLLGRYLFADPHEFRFATGPQGKPHLAANELEFNVSHSSGMVALAFTRSAPIGIDIESEERALDPEPLARRNFAPSEVAAGIEDFFTIWTRKEAVIKAAGGGLSHTLSSFEVVPTVEGFAPVLNRGDDPRLDGWFVLSLPSPAPRFHAAIAARGARWKVRTLFFD